MRTRRPWRMVAPLATVIALFAGWSGYWQFASSAAQNYVARTRGDLAKQGTALTCAQETWGGYPFRFEFTCTRPHLVHKDGETLDAAAVFVAAQAYDPFHLVAIVEGPSTAVLPDGSSYVVRHTPATISVIASKSGTVRVSAEVRKVDSQRLTANDIQLHTRPAAAGGTDIAIGLAGAAYLSPGKPPLPVDRADIQATLSPAHDLTISVLSFSKDKLQLSGTGTLKLDAQHRPDGRIQAQTNDLDGLLAMLDPHLDLRDDERAVFKSLLGLLGREARAELVARNGDFFIGPLKVAEFKPLY